MNNFVSLFVAMLEHLKMVTEDEARKLIKDLHSSTLPGTYEEASRLVKDLYNKYDISTVHDHVSTRVQDMKSYVDTEIEKVRTEHTFQIAKSKKPVDTK